MFLAHRSAVARALALAGVVLIVAAVGLWMRPEPRAIALGEVDALPAKASARPASDSPPIGQQEAPFDLPSLADLDATADWQDQRVAHAVELERQRQASSPAVASLDRALKLANDSPASNEIIQTAFGRLPDRDEQVNWDATLRRHSPADLKSSNPLLLSSVLEAQFRWLTGLNLFLFDWHMEPFANQEVVARWQTSRDRLVDKVTLRDDLTWSDGRPVTAHDVAFSFQALRDARVPALAARAGIDQLRWVAAYDDRTLVYFHQEPLATNIWNVDFPVIPRHVYGETIETDPTLQRSEHHRKLENQPVCGGPYVLTSWRRGQELVLSRRDDWPLYRGRPVRPRPYFKEIRIKIVADPTTALELLKRGELDEMELSPAQWIHQTGDEAFARRNTKVRAPGWMYYYIGWNNDATRAPFFADRRVRQAMSLAFDYEGLHQRLNLSLHEPCNGIFHTSAWMAPKPAPRPYTQDLDRAEDLLDQAGWIDRDGDRVRENVIDGRKVDFEFTLLVGESPESQRIGQLLRTELARIGVSCRVRALDETTLRTLRQERRFHAVLGSWSPGTDIDATAYVWRSGAPRNYVSYSNREVDRLYDACLHETDRGRRAEMFGQIHRLIYQDQPYTFLYFRNSFYAFNKELRGFVLSPRGPFNYAPGQRSLWRAADRGE